MGEHQDLEQLDEEEQKVLAPLLRRRGGYAGTAGFFLAAFPLLALVGIAMRGGDVRPHIDALLVVKVVGFLVLALFAWRWSVIAPIGMLPLHLFLNTGYLGSPSVLMKTSYFVFAGWIALGALAAYYRRTLLAKAAATRSSGERADRWLRIYQQRARATGDLPPEEFLRDSGIGADDPMWKQDNSNPAEGFAVNLDTTYDEVRNMDEALGHTVDAVDDFGRHVSVLPILETGASVMFDFVNGSFTHDPGVNLTPFEFLRWQAELLEELFEGGDRDDGIEIGVDRSIFRDRITRLSWNPDDRCWRVVVDYGDGG